MKGVSAALLALLGIAISATLAAQEPVPVEELETVLVSGEQPGPGLWKVSRDDHVMWILGSYRPLSAGLKWRSEHVESLIAGSQEVLYPGRANVAPDIGLFKAMTLLPSIYSAAKSAVKIPDGGTLQDVLPAEIYAKWLPLRQKYMGNDDDIEKKRPMFAIDELSGEAVRKSGLTFANNIDSVVSKAAKSHKIPVRTLPTVERRIKVENPKAILKAFEKAAGETGFADVDCFNRNLDLIEPGIEAMKAHANAWATGDLAALRDRSSAPWVQDCTGEMMNAAVSTGALGEGAGGQAAVDALKKSADLFAEASRQVEQDWLEAVQAALARNQCTFAVLPMRFALSPDSYVARLREMGYTVEEP